MHQKKTAAGNTGKYYVEAGGSVVRRTINPMFGSAGGGDPLVKSFREGGQRRNGKVGELSTNIKIGGIWMFPRIVVQVPPNHPILIGFSIIFTIHFGIPLFLETPI